MKTKNPLNLKAIHPNSRKCKSISKNLTRIGNRQKSKFGNQMKQNVLGEKILWFQDNFPSQEKLTPTLTMELIEKYLHRFDEELEQIALKHSVGNHRQRQHASREDVLKHTIQREREEYNTCGLEIPDVMNAQEVKRLLEWTGELRYLQNFKLRRFSSKYLTSEAAHEVDSSSI